MDAAFSWSDAMALLPPSSDPCQAALMAATHELEMNNGQTVPRLPAEEAVAIAASVFQADRDSVLRQLIEILSDAVASRTLADRSAVLAVLLQSSPLIKSVTRSCRVPGADDSLRRLPRALRCRPATMTLDWSQEFQELFPYAKHLVNEWEKWLLHNTPSLEQLARKKLIDFWPEYRAAQHHGDEFRVPKTQAHYYLETLGGEDFNSTTEYTRLLNGLAESFVAETDYARIAKTFLSYIVHGKA